ncbi:hypothetical protein KSS87_017188 [Heliosperma pusillum]|nr:hypothetical protein KSS87_017188 [Heliosperma pusillum]
MEKMENYNKTVHSFTGNNENESENQKNSQQKNKNFMSPTISASSKFNSSSNKKIFGEWKSPRSDLCKLGNSNSGSRKSLPKIPLISPKNVVHSPKNNDELVHDDGSVIDSCDVPYDPLTNYLSPRPKFLRYRPNRRREILVKSDHDSDSDSDSLRDSIDSQGSSCIDSLSKKEIEEIVISDKQVVVLDEEEEDLDEYEEENWGLKWGLFKFLIVFCSLFFCTMFICSIDSSSFVVKQEFKGVGIEYKQVVNMGFKIVSLSSLDSGTLILGRKNGTDTGLLELGLYSVEFDENLSKIDDQVSGSVEDYYQIRPRLEDVFRVNNLALEADQKNMSTEVYETKLPKKIRFLKDYYQSRPRLEDEFGVTNVVLELVEGPRSEDFSGVVLGSVVDNAAEVPDNNAIEEEIGKPKDFGEGHVEFDEEDGTADARLEYYQSEIDAQMAASELSEVPDVEVPYVGEENSGIPDSRIEYYTAEIEAPMVASEISEAPDVEVPNVGEEKSGNPDSRIEYYPAEIEAPMVASEISEAPDVEVPNVGEEKSGSPDSRIEYYPAEVEAQMVASEQSEAPDVEIAPNFEAKSNDAETGSKESNTEAKSKEERKANEVEGVAKDFILTLSERIWPVMSSVIAFGLLAWVWRFYCKCKRTSSKTRSSNVNLGSNIGTAAKSRPRLPPKSVEKTDRYHQLSAAPSFRKFDHTELNPPSIATPMEIELARDDHTIIPKVKQLGEFEIGVEFTQPLKTHPLKDETMCFTPDIKGATRRASVSGRAPTVQPSSSESYSCGSYISQNTASMKKDGKEEVSTKATPTPRRSTRLRSKGVTSP